MIGIDFEDKSKKCVKCGSRTMAENEYKGQDYCSLCYKKSVEYESDKFRLMNDIRNKDPRQLTWYQRAQRRQMEDYVYVSQISMMDAEADLNNDF